MERNVGDTPSSQSGSSTNAFTSSELRERAAAATGLSNYNRFDSCNNNSANEPSRSYQGNSAGQVTQMDSVRRPQSGQSSGSTTNAFTSFELRERAIAADLSDYYRKNGLNDNGTNNSNNSNNSNSTNKPSTVSLVGPAGQVTQINSVRYVTQCEQSGSATNAFTSSEIRERAAAAGLISRSEEEVTNAIPSEELQKRIDALNNPTSREKEKMTLQNKSECNDKALSASFSLLTVSETDVAADTRVVISPPPPFQLPGSLLEAVALPLSPAAAPTGQDVVVVVARRSPLTTDFTLELGNNRSCCFFYDVASDDLIARNVGLGQLHLIALGTDEADVDGRDKYGKSASIDSRMVQPISPGYWRIAGDKDGKPDEQLAELLIFRRRFNFRRSRHIAAAAGSKRPVSEDDDEDVAVAERSTSIELVSRENPMLEVRQATKLDVTSPNPDDDFTVTNLRDIVDRSATMVFRGMHSKFGDSVVKVIRRRNYSPESPDVMSLAATWRQEAEFMASVEHESIVKFYGADSRFFTIFMEYLPYPDLADARNMSTHLFSGTNQDALRILRDSSSALSYLAERKIMHNDIKPGNILYDKNRGAVLIDFGMACFEGKSSDVGGTPHYMAPESVEFGGRILKSDIFSLGVTMLYLLKIVPLPEATVRAWHITEMECPSAEDWRSSVRRIRGRLNVNGVERIVSKMLQWKPEDRVSADALAELLASSSFGSSTDNRIHNLD